MKKLIRGGLVIDGTGKPGYQADVLVENDKIVKMYLCKTHVLCGISH